LPANDLIGYRSFPADNHQQQGSEMNEHVAPEDYNLTPYPSLSYAYTHPDLFAALGHLLDMKPADPEHCRYLDVGCAVGGNILPLAEALPNSQFVGIDQAEKQIEIARQHAELAGLSNISFETMDIMDVPEDFGLFDYIVAHGIYSWVPAEVRDGLLALIRRHLAPEGIAYVSYNIYPAWHMMLMIREMMLFRTRQVSDSHERATLARELIELIVEGQKEEQGGYVSFLKTYLEELDSRLGQGKDVVDSLLLHDELADINEPLHFYEFAQHADQFGLQYLSEAQFARVIPSRFSREIVVRLAEISETPIELEQYMDYMSNQGFRRSLLVHKETAFDKTLRPILMPQFRFSTQAKADSEEVDLSPEVVEKFLASDGAVFSSNHPLSKAAMQHLIAVSPQIVAFSDLSQAAKKLIDPAASVPADEEVQLLAATLLRAFTYSDKLVNIHYHPPEYVTKVSERPLVSQLVRWQATQWTRVTNRRHERVLLDSLTRIVLSMLDGSRTRQELLHSLQTLYDEGKLTLKEQPEQEEQPLEASEIIERNLDQTLAFLARTALLIA
jgi:methyltransferase-like protein/2-polyprenyl-3-methyl-5-hydroxy-6-metoxy-1,4-benzoquinol methylase